MKKILPFILAFVVSTEKIAAQCAPQLLDCSISTSTFCDVSTNDPFYWSTAQWWDGINQSHDLAETAIDVQFVYRDTCPIAGLSVRCLLYLDLDGDGVQETLVDSDNPPAAGELNFGNATGVGVARSFDQRIVPANQKWLFALETRQLGDTTTTKLRWNTQTAAGVFALPEIAHGLHKVRWELRDGTGILKTCETPVLVKDCKAPTIVCINGLGINIASNNNVKIWASDIFQYTEDNVTPNFLLTLGIRRAGTGTGFPVDANGEPINSLIFDCTELGTQLLELWVIDLAGNADYCQTSITVADNNQHCGNGSAVFNTCVIYGCDEGVLDEITFKIEYEQNGQQVTEFILNSCEELDQTFPANTDVTFTPTDAWEVTPPVTTYDLVLINHHVTGQNLFDEPFQFVAADANRDGVINQADIVVCRDHILGIVPLPEPIRFVDKSYASPWLPNPLAGPLPGFVTVNNNDPLNLGAEFIAIGICDVSCSGLIGFFEIMPENQHLIGIPQPNPTTGSTMLPLQLIQEETVIFELTDASGKLLYKQTVLLPAGDSMFDVPAAAMPVSGLYFWRISAGEVFRTGKISRI